MYTMFMLWGGKFECLKWSRATAMIMMTVGIMTQTLYYTTGGESTVSHRGDPGSNPSQSIWDLCFGKKMALGHISFQVLPLSPSVPYHKTTRT